MRTFNFANVKIMNFRLDDVKRFVATHDKIIAMKTLNLGSGGPEGFVLYTLFFLDNFALDRLPDHVICVSASALAFYFVYVLCDYYKCFTREELRDFCHLDTQPSKLDLILYHRQLLDTLRIRIPQPAKEITFAAWYEVSRQKDLRVITTKVGRFFTFERKVFDRLSNPDARVWEVVSASCNVIPSLSPHSYIDGWYSGDYTEREDSSLTLFVRMSSSKSSIVSGDVVYLDRTKRYVVSPETLSFCVQKWE